MRRARRLWPPILAALLVWASPALKVLDRFRNVRAFIQEEIEAGRVPSLAVVARLGEIVWEEGFGWADRDRQIPAMPHTLFSLASVSKPLTAPGERFQYSNLDRCDRGQPAGLRRLKTSGGALLLWVGRSRSSWGVEKGLVVTS